MSKTILAVIVTPLALLGGIHEAKATPLVLQETVSSSSYPYGFNSPKGFVHLNEMVLHPFSGI